MYRISPICFIKCIVTLTCLIVTWNLLPSGKHHEIANDGNYKYTCNMTKEYLSDLERLFQRVHIILEKHKLKHILCYGTLWGQIRGSTLLPWSEKAEFCIFNEQIEQIDEGHFYSSFHRNFLRLRYYSSDGVYVVEDIHKSYPFIQIFVFQKDEEQQMYKRIGWKRRILPPNCEWTPSLDCFPVFLIQQNPLPDGNLGLFTYNVPMGGIEIQKYHYRDNWWKKVETKNCNLKL